MTEATTETTIDLEQFCGDADRFGMDFSKPSTCGTFRYYCDGRICVRVPTTATPDVEDAAKVGERSATLKWPNPLESVLKPWPAPVYAFHRVKVETGCDSCDDEWTEYGFEPIPDAQDLDARRIGSGYHHMIAQLPNARYLSGGEPNEGVYFRFDGGEGILMPLMKARDR